MTGSAKNTEDRPHITLSPHAEAVLRARYYLRDTSVGIVEDFPKLVHRVADFLAGPEQHFGGEEMVQKMREIFYRQIVTLRLIPSSPILMNAGTASPYCAACYVLPLYDSMESIMETLKRAMLIQKSGGGIGLSFSRIRAAGSPVGGTGGVASGPLPFITMYNSGSVAVKQGGRRRGALMAVLQVDHSDIMDFIEAKTKIGTLSNFNLSVAVTDAFMQAVARDEEHPLIDPGTGQAVRTLRARDILRRIAECAWQCGDPGVVFIDEVNRHNPLRGSTIIEAINPCGEQPLEPWGVCCLASINLSAHVSGGEIDRPGLQETTCVGVRLLDNAIDASSYPLPENEETARPTRKIGLGVMGLAHMLARIGIAYDSDEAVAVTERLMEFISKHAAETSRLLAKERGPFPDFHKSMYAKRGEPPMRNATQTTIAPTGTISIIANTSSGIEPIFALAYTRTAPDGRTFSVLDPVFKDAAEKGGIYK